METLEQIIIKYNLHKTDHMEGTDKYSIHQYIQRFYENIFLNYFINRLVFKSILKTGIVLFFETFILSNNAKF